MNSSKVTSPSPLSLVYLEASYAIPSWMCYGLLVRDYRTPPKQGTAYEPYGGDRLLGLGFSGCLSFSMLCFGWKDSIFVHRQINTHRLNMYEELENSRSLCFKSKWKNRGQQLPLLLLLLTQVQLLIPLALEVLFLWLLLVLLLLLFAISILTSRLRGCICIPMLASGRCKRFEKHVSGSYMSLFKCMEKVDGGSR